MTGGRWSEARELFFRAREMSSGDRLAFLAQATDCAQLRLDVESLIAHDELAVEWMPDLSDGSSSEAPKDLGPYRIEREIGRGGMGIVYQATRQDGTFEKTVAVKIVNTRAVDASLIRRFLQERQILAGIEHPFIARLIDGGVAADYRPYLVMEHVDGVSIKDYCSDSTRTRRQILELFCRVCSAVHFLHQNLIVHGDLKPSNILVTEHGDPKILDFGVARMIDDAARPHQSSRAYPLTSSYASPEQIHCKPITTTSDVYSLGVVLLELLAYRDPHFCKAVWNECDSSERVGSLEAVSGSLPVQRLAAWRFGSIWGELESVVLKALEEDPARRYGSAESMAGDIRSHLDGYPVSSRDPSWPYRVSKFVLRNMRGAVVALAFSLSVVFFVITTRSALNDARSEAAARKTVNLFLVHLFDRADPSVARDGTVSARELVERAAMDVKHAFREDPIRRSELNTTLGVILRKLGLHERAQLLLGEALQERRQVFGPDSSEVAISLFQLAVLKQEKGEYSEAESLFESSIEIQERVSPSDGLLAPTLGHFADLQRLLGQYQRSEELFSKGFEAMARAVESPIVEMKLRTGRGVLLAEKGKIGEAKVQYLKAIGIGERSLGRGHLDLAVPIGMLASLYLQAGDIEHAMSFCQRALSIRESYLEPEHPAIYDLLHTLAQIYSSAGDDDLAEELYQRILADSEVGNGGGNAELGASLHNLAVLYSQQERLDRAEVLYGRALHSFETTLGKKNPRAATVLEGLSFIQSSRGNSERAIALLTLALDTRVSILGWTHEDVAHNLSNLGSTYFLLGKYDRAEPLYERAHEIFVETLGSSSVFVASPLSNLAAVYLATERLELAEEYYRRALEIRESYFGLDHTAVARCRIGLGEVFVRKEKFERAGTLFQSVVSSMEGLLLKYPEDRRVLRMLAWGYLGLGTSAAGEEEMGLARRSWLRSLACLEPVVRNSEETRLLDLYAKVLIHLGRLVEAEPIVARLTDKKWSDRSFLELCRRYGL